ncbi:Undecaprenyl-diphosphatase 2 (fragment) [Candidatus Desulfosporosinus infrequens]|uniref:Undecaprenyl-diphosphatase 2 n=1 Tax=Candidatus Desulfosporosinus infrequens TaxID=2043169 RepID=A0A2U3L116_9FIRM
MFLTTLTGGLFAGIFAYIAVPILMRWFKKKEINAMRPFTYYCWIVGGLVLPTHFI